jgi:hypothetical protein
MNICSNGHEEIVYECKNCPACDLLRDISEMQTQIEYLEKENTSDNN